MSVLRKFGSFFRNTLKKVGQVGNQVLSGIGSVKNAMDTTGVTGALTGLLAANPATAPIAAGLSFANPVIGAGKGLMSAMSKVG
jgi:hypothetical protein